jgi:PKD repeat protein
MVAKNSLTTPLAVLVLLLVGGGTVVGILIPAMRGQVGGLTAGPADDEPPTTQLVSGIGDLVGFGYSVAGSTAGIGGTSPSTTVLGPTYTTSETASSTATSTSTIANQGGPAGNSSGTGPSGTDIEFYSSLTLNVTQPSQSLQKAGEIASSLGGYVEQSQYGQSLATMTVRVPGQNYAEALAQLEALGSLVSATSSSDDVAVQYADLNATLQSLVTEQDSLLKLLGTANTVNATLDIESVLQKTDAQINSVESSILETGQLIDYATIGIDFQTSASHASVPLAVKLSATPLKGLSPLSVTFNAVVTGGTQPYIVNFNFGDGTASQGQQLIHQFTQPGTYNVTVSATDQSGDVSLAWIIVQVVAPPASSGLSSFGGYVWGLFAGVVEGIVEVAAIVLPIFAVLYVAVFPAYRKLSKPKDGQQAETETGKLP